jgi:uncharacterized damage-inducible protein DinB
MNKAIDNLKKTRLFLLNIIEELSEAQLNEIPEGFNNNVIWNITHLLATQQMFCYVRTGQQPVIHEQYIEQYKPGTKPEPFVAAQAIATIKTLLTATTYQLENDYTNNLFVNYESWSTRSGIAINTIEDAIQFMAFHEGMHTGYIMALKRVLKSKV